MDKENIPLLDCPIDYIMGEASGKLLNEYGRFPCKLQCGTYAFMVQGTARATLNISHYDFREHDLVYIEPGSFFLIHEFSEDAKVCYIIFSSSFLERNTYGSRRSYTTLQGRTPIVHVTGEQAQIILHFSSLMSDAINCTPSMLTCDRMVDVFNLIQHTYLDYFLSADSASAQPVDRKTEIYRQYSDLVLQHYHEWHHVSEYARQMRITMPHLCSTIKSVSNRTAGDMIIDALLMDAKSQLKITSLPIKEIALGLGFTNVAFFNRFFKSHTGQTPKSYRSN